MTVESIRFRGIIYRRYPDAATHAERSYYVAGIADRKRGALRLHEDVWRARWGEIPEGHDIHHVDGDVLNNSVGNLIAMDSDSHQSLHRAERIVSGFYRTPERLAHVDRIRPLTKEWHASDEGRAWHVEHGRIVAAAREYREEICRQCGAVFQTRTFGDALFCRNACKSAARRDSGVDNVQRACAECDQSFTVNKYVKKMTCSPLCARRRRERV